VIEDRRGPRNGVMASRQLATPKSRARRGVHWISRLLPGRQWQPNSRSPSAHRQVVIVVEVAGSASHIGVAVGQKKSRGAVIEDRRGPRNRVVASVAVGTPKAAPAEECTGLFVCCQSRQVAPEFPQSVGPIIKL